MAFNDHDVLKKRIKWIIITVFVFITFGTAGKAAAQAQELQQLILDIEKLTQLKGILSDMETGYQIYQQGYGSISQLSKGNFDLHSVYLNGLLSVNPTVRNYSRVADILTQQANLIHEYKSSYKQFSQSGTFSTGELNYMSNIYAQLVNQSLQNLDELASVLTAGKLRMTDDERMRAIDRIYASTSDKLQFLRHFNRQGVMLSMQRSKDIGDTRTLKQLYGLNN